MKQTKDEDKTKEQLIQELVELRQQIGRLSALKTQHRGLEERRVVRIGEILVEMLFLTRSQLENALASQIKTGKSEHKRLGEILLESGLITEEQLRLAIKEQISRGGRPPGELYNVLVVDDDVNNVRALEELLMPEYNVLSATSSEQALAIIEQGDIALIIADYRMPGMPGTELLKRVLQKSPSTIGLVLAAYTDEKQLMASMNTMQAHGFVQKPWDPQELRFTVRRWVEAYEAFAKLDEKARQSEDLQKQLEKTNTRVVELTRQLDQSQRLLENYRKPWYRRWFGKRNVKEERRNHAE